MRVKEIDRTANIAWSPAGQHPIYVVAGTAAQQLDATFSTSAALELYSLNVEDSSLNMPLVASIPSECRFHKVLWGSHGLGEAGTIVAGADNGGLLVYSADKLLHGNKDCLMFKKDKHSGAVKALDFNAFQSNLLATGGAESEIFIWDLNNPETPMTPGAKSQPAEDVACLAWNRQVQHILGSTFAARCVVWDLRKNEPIIKVSDSMSRIKCKHVVWHPEVATQMCLSSEDDHSPVIQLWDLRYATSPVKVLENHQRGILSMAWCPRDPDLLLSCGKDNRILCWNPNSNVQGGEVVYELPTSHQWSFDVQWCPRNPAIISSSSFDGHVTIFSLMGGGHPIHQADRIADSFSSSDPFAQAAAAQQQAQQNVMPLQKPPKWLKKPVGANFGFGGKLVSFENAKTQAAQQPGPRQISLSQVVTETEFLSRSVQLEQALANNQHMEFCAMKAANCADNMQENIWKFLMVNFEKEPRERYIQLLGYDKTDLAKKVSSHSADSSVVNGGVDADELAQKMSLLGAGEMPQIQALASSGQASPSVGSKRLRAWTPGSRDEPTFSDGSSAFDEIASHSKPRKSESPLVIPSDDDAEGLLSQALLMGNFEAAVDMCISEGKMAEAILLAIAGGPELLSRTQKRFFQRTNSNVGRLISSIVTHDWSHIVCTCDLDNWKEALAIILTYSPAEEFASLCDSLASRLENERNGELSSYASLCYICSGNVEKLVQNWHCTSENTSSPQCLQDLVEKVMILRKAVEMSRGQAPEITTGLLSEKLSSYASILAAQGSLEVALEYLGTSNEMSLALLRDRLCKSLGYQNNQSPFQKINVQPQIGRSSEQAKVAPSQHQTYQAQARGNVQTVTTASTNYPNVSQYGGQYSAMNGPHATPVPTYNPTPVMSQAPSTAPSAMSKGPLSHKYPSYQSGAAYGVSTYPTTTGYSQPNDYSQQQNYYGSPQYMTPTSQPTGPSNATPGGPAYNPPVSNQPTVPSFMDHKPDQAWNDPPPVKEKTKQSAVYEAPAAITAPIFGVPQPQPTDQGAPGAPMNYGNFYNPQEHMNDTQTVTSVAHQPPPTQTQQKAPASPVAKEPPKEVVKGPIPEEHKILQDVLEALVQNCQAKAANAQTKRKLEDVHRKLEVLYDRLRDNSLSQSVILGLHQIVQTIRQYDYNSGLAVYTQMVSHGNFSEISHFMPGLKMLIQTATQLQVYVQVQ